MTSNDIAELCSVSLRQVQLWCERGVIRSSFNRYRREFAHDQALRAMIVACLKSKGVSLYAIRLLVGGMRRFPEDWLVVDPGKHHTIIWCNGPQEMLEIFKKSRVRLFVVPVGELRQKLETAIALKPVARL